MSLMRSVTICWDGIITDYGLGKFDEVGFSLFTIRNGNLKMQDKYKNHTQKNFSI